MLACLLRLGTLQMSEVLPLSDDDGNDGASFARASEEEAGEPPAARRQPRRMDSRLASMKGASLGKKHMDMSVIAGLVGPGGEQAGGPGEEDDDEEGGGREAAGQQGGTGEGEQPGGALEAARQAAAKAWQAVRRACTWRNLRALPRRCWRRVREPVRARLSNVSRLLCAALWPSSVTTFELRFLSQVMPDAEWYRAWWFLTVAASVWVAVYGA